MENSLACCIVVGLILAGCSDPAPPTEFDPSAFQIPVLAEMPRLDKQILAGEWDDAATIQGIFLISDGTKAAGVYPFEVHLGHDDKWLFAYVEVHDVPENPFNNKTPGHEDWHGFDMSFFMDTDFEPTLDYPEDWKGFLNLRESGTDITDGFWNGQGWEVQAEGSSPDYFKWGDDDRPNAGTWGRGFYEGDDLYWEIFIPLKSPNKEHDGFQVRPGDVFRMGFMFGIQGTDSPDGEWPITAPRDTWPGERYTPRNHLDPSTWQRMQLSFS